MKHILIDRYLFAHSSGKHWRNYDTWRALTHSARHVFQTILLHRNNKTGIAFPSEDRLMALTGYSRQTISKAVNHLNNLNDFHIIRKNTGRFSHNGYQYSICSTRPVFIPQWIIHRYHEISPQAVSCVPTMMYLSEPIGEHKAKTEHLLKGSKNRIATISGVDHHRIPAIIDELRKVGFLRRKKDGIHIQLYPPKPKALKRKHTTKKLPDGFF